MKNDVMKTKHPKMLSLSMNNIKDFFNTYKEIILMGISLLANYFIFIIEYADSSKMSQGLLLISYKDIGFSSRTLLGSILSLIGNSSSDIPAKITFANVFLSIVYFSICVLFFGLIITTLNGKKHLKNLQNSKNVPNVMMMLFCACPFFIYVFSYEFFGSVNSFLLLLMLVCFFLMRNPKLLPVIPFICAFAILVDHIFALIYLPIICILLWNKSKNSIKNPYKKTLIFTVLIGFLLFFSMIPFSSPSDFEGVKYSEKNDIFYAMNFKFIQDLLQNVRILQKIPLGKVVRFSFALPLIVFLVFLWIYCIKMSKNKERKILILSFAQLLILLVPLFFYDEFGSWIAAVLSSQTVLVVSFASDKNSVVNVVIRKLDAFLKKNPLIIFAVVFIFYFDVMEVLPILLEY